MKFDLPKKCGDMYIVFDKKKNPLYGFKLTGYRDSIIAEFVRLTEKLPEFIVLPKINEKAFVPEKEEEFDFSNLNTFLCEGYVKGNLILCSKSFKGIDKAKIVLPFNTSVMLDWGCFDDGAKIEFIVPENIGLKQIYRTFDTGFDYQHENWPILCDKRIVCEIGAYGDSHTAGEYTKECNPYNSYKISEDYCVDVENEEIVETSHTID